MTKIVTLYNNKGGVSKTTTLFNIAAYLSTIGKKVLIVDCDPQCNVTELFFAAREDVDNPDFELPGTSIYGALLPRFKGQQATINQDQIELTEHNLYSGLFLFRGDMEFARAETYFGTAWNQAITENIHEKNTYVVFDRLMKSLGKERNFDFILCDVGPSTGAISRTVILTCDEIVIPLVPDRFCFQAVKLLGQIIKEWIDRHKVISESLVPFEVAPFAGEPRLAGTVVQNFKVHSGARAKQSYIKWQDKITQQINLSLTGPGGIPIKSGFNTASPYIASIRDVAVLAPVAQMFGRAIFDIQQEHTKEASTDGSMYYGSVWTPWEDRMKSYKEEIAKICKAIS
ncbi:ParA family protein [Stenotrophomonas maltophilia]|uniref:AAA family ATPase n=1 Tax=Stenotrophomonas riyadhensis TaxID=2859893 RepID=A0ABT2XL60_9GAMM|nr:AAA family ATPase [Stenotrophomonas sp. CFS3442]MBH1620123.1 ParA family protein [Stenotrophomonas maltophilia]MCV0326671.1 AAA family ATPase [Stenotrophomonas sp. CFS3442]HEL4244778.1 ParA family protein [Stenotrophomonas maltophilia]